MTVSLATIHHEGAGTPSDDPRGAPGGYTYWIGATRWERLRTVDTSYATLHFNHVSLDICLSGNRMVEPVTDNDIALIHGAFMDCRAHGEVVDTPQVQAHRDNNGLYYFNGSLFSTVCPGDLTMARWPAIVAACRPAAPVPVIPPKPTWRLPLIFLWQPALEGIWLVMDGPGGKVTYITKNSAVIQQGMNMDPADAAAFGTRTIARLVHRTRNDGTPGFSIVATDGATYVPQNQH